MPADIKTDPRPTGERFAYWLAKAAIQARESVNATPEHVAAVARLRAETVTRFEKIENWPRDPERLIAAYAQVAGMPDARMLFDRALDLWYEGGEAPTLNQDGAAQLTVGQQFVKELDARRRRPRAPGGPAQKPTAVPKRRASS